jgi:hypothetical protein
MTATNKRSSSLLLAFGGLALAALACAQAGEIFSDAEATQRAIPTATEVVDLSGEAEYQIGEEVQIFGGTFGALVPLYGEPGGRFFTSQVPNGSLVSVLELGLADTGEIWYEVEGNAGRGWIRAANLIPPEAEDTAGADSSAAEPTPEPTPETTG